MTAKTPEIIDWEAKYKELEIEAQKLKNNVEYLVAAFNTVGGAVDMARKVRF